MIKIKILITGSNGFVGANLVEYILEIFTNIYEAANSEGENNSNSEDKGDFKIHSNIKSIFRTVLEKRASANKDDQNERSLEIRCMILKGTDISELENLQNKLIELKKEKKIEYLYFNDVELTIKFGNLLDVQSLIECTKDIDVVVHLAGLVTDWAPKKLFFKIILEGTKNLLNACSENHVSRFIYMSSLTVHELNGHHYDNEEAPRDMKFYPYGVAKKMAEDEVKKWVEDKEKDDSEKRDYAIIRPGFIIYGPRDKGSFILALDAIINGKFGFINKGKALISYVYVKNLCHGISLLIFSEQVRGAYIILDGNKTWREFIGDWTKLADVKMPHLNTPYHLLFPLVWLLEKIYKLFRIKKRPILTIYSIRIPRKDLAFVSEKVRKELGYTPVVPYELSLKRTLNYYNKWKLNERK